MTLYRIVQTMCYRFRVRIVTIPQDQDMSRQIEHLWKWELGQFWLLSVTPARRSRQELHSIYAFQKPSTLSTIPQKRLFGKARTMSPFSAWYFRILTTYHLTRPTLLSPVKIVYKPKISDLVVCVSRKASLSRDTLEIWLT